MARRTATIIAAIEEAHAVDFTDSETEFADWLALARAGVSYAVIDAMAKWSPFSAGRRFRDCPECGCMVVVPAAPEGFWMGSPAGEDGRGNDEGPRHEVTIPKAFAVATHEVTVGEFRRFVKATGHQLGKDCWIWTRDRERGYEKELGRGWKAPGFHQEDDHPVVCVSWDDAQAYAEWLSIDTGKEYWLLSETRWEHMARAGTKTARYWGETAAEQDEYENWGDKGSGGFDSHEGDDGSRYTRAVRKYQANGYGIFDTLGNVEEWTADCYQPGYQDAPVDGAARTGPLHCSRAVRGGAFNSAPGRVRSAHRRARDAGSRYHNLGFRVGRTIDQVSTSGAR